MVNDIAFSPDDRQIAFTWEGPGLGRRNVYVEMIGGDRPVQITDTKSGTISGVDWSPDGHLISFGRCGDENRGAIYTIPVAGGPEKKLTDAACQYGRTGGVWTPDGHSLVFADECTPGGPLGVAVFTLATGDKRCLVRPDSNDIRLVGPNVSPDGRTVSYERRSTLGVADLYTIPIEGGTPIRITYEKQACCSVFTKDSKYIVFSSNWTGTFGRWRVPTKGGVVEPEVDTAYVHDGFLSRDGRRLAYWEYSGPGSAIWRVQLLGPGGRVLSQRKILELKGGLNESQQLSPDGKQITFAAAGSGTGNIWKSDADGSNPLQLTSFGGALTGSPRWSSDGKWIVFDRREGDHAQVFVIDAEGRNHRELTNGSFENNVPSWSRDGKSIYFSSNRTGQYELWKKDLGSGRESQVTRHGGFSAFESYDRQDLYYTKFYTSGIWRMPVAGGEEQRITDGPENWYWGAWAITRMGLYYMDVDASPRPTINFYDFSTRRTKSVFQPGGQTLPHEESLDASADGRIVLVAQHDQSSTIIISEKFQ
jgi:Tol biopolymer transport system component